MASRPEYQPRYDSSHALVVGVSRYQHMSDLDCAADDAKDFAALLVDYGFPKPVLLRDEEATKARIIEAFEGLGSKAMRDDRVVIYFAGHGHRVERDSGVRGYFYPYDAKSNGDPFSLIRWRFFQSHSEDFKAKHIFFLIDTCYSGIMLSPEDEVPDVLSRKAVVADDWMHDQSGLKPDDHSSPEDDERLPPHERLKRHLTRSLLSKAHQVLTAGKADRPVDDRGGALSGHSPFTGLLIKGLRGMEALNPSVACTTAQDVATYVQDQLTGLGQTPQVGSLRGDGNMVFWPLPNVLPALLREDASDGAVDSVATPDVTPEPTPGSEPIRRVRQLARRGDLAELLSLLEYEMRRFDRQTKDRNHESGGLTESDFRRRIRICDQAGDDLHAIHAVLGSAWGNPKAILRGSPDPLAWVPLGLVDASRTGTGGAAWGRKAAGNTASAKLPANRLSPLDWYPPLCLQYASGIGSITAGRFDNLAWVLTVRLGLPGERTGIATNRPVEEILATDFTQALFVAVQHAAAESQIPDNWWLSNDQATWAPRSQHLHTLLASTRKQILTPSRTLPIETEYDDAFDKFEIVYWLQYANLTGVRLDLRSFGRFATPDRALGKDSWDPATREFADRPTRCAPYNRIRREVDLQGVSWPLFRRGLFGGKSRFDEVCGWLQDELSKLGF